MRLTWKRSEKAIHATLEGEERRIACWCKVRNELNGLRPRKDGDAADLFCISPIGGAEGSGPPSMPRKFPVGSWKITTINPHPDKRRDGYLYPFWIGTDAKQRLDVWALDDGGRYDRPTGEKIWDTGYGLHFSKCDWTLGCIRIARESDLRWLVANVRRGDSFEVVD